jgi:hypothetical protein
MHIWPSHFFRLLARLVRRASHFLERQSQRLEAFAESTVGARASRGGPEADRAPDQPPMHWLEKIEASEESIRWIHHREGNVPPSPLEGTFPRFSDSEISAQKPARSSSRDSSIPGGRDRKDETVESSSADPDRARPSGLSAFAGSPAPPDQQPSAGSAEADAAKTRDRSPSVFSISGSTGHPEYSESGVSPEPVQFQLSSPESGPAMEGSSGEEGSETSRRSDVQPSPMASETPRSATQSPRSPGRTSAAGAAPSRDEDIGYRQSRTGSHRHKSSSAGRVERPFSRRRASDRTSSKITSSDVSTDRTIEQGSPRRGKPSVAKSEASTAREHTHSMARASSREPQEIQSKRSSTRANDGNERSRSVQSQWPELPTAEQIIVERASEPFGWHQLKSRFDRRRRLDKEQRGQLWNV